jgi:hypothetical protein
MIDSAHLINLIRQAVKQAPLEGNALQQQAQR